MTASSLLSSWGIWSTIEWKQAKTTSTRLLSPRFLLMDWLVLPMAAIEATLPKMPPHFYLILLILDASKNFNSVKRLSCSMAFVYRICWNTFPQKGRRKPWSTKLFNQSMTYILMWLTTSFQLIISKNCTRCTWRSSCRTIRLHRRSISRIKICFLPLKIEKCTWCDTQRVMPLIMTL